MKDDLGLNSKFYAKEDFKEYLEKGADYYKKYPDWENILKHVDIDLQLDFLKKCFKRNLVENKELTFEDLESFFKNKCLIVPCINRNVLKNKEGFVGHFVLITNIAEDYVEFHDPGLPPIQNRKVGKEEFIKSFYDPNTARWALVVSGKKNDKN
ncbi:MAG: hypothetical protein JSW73_02995 [Candidatus Woesearchaeota archaeon]|nr:MAG: hypothetical protein JSW73_02995 [Candidatus Woesearchaeota archaeon]